MERFMPKGTAKATERLAEALAFEQARREQVALCKGCGVAARVPDPVRCTVCGGTDFEVVAPEVIDRIAAAEGGTVEERTYDGRKLAWTQDARKALRAIPDRYQRRRAKARIEKNAHGQRAETITFEMAQRFIEEETGVLYEAGSLEEGDAAADEDGTGVEIPRLASLASFDSAQDRRDRLDSHEPDEDGVKLVARDAANNPLLSRFDWTDDAVARVLRVPAGFMRDRTQTRIEELAAERGLAPAAGTIDLALVEDGIEHGRRMMAEMLGQMEAGKAGDGAAAAKPNGGQAAGAGECPVDHAAEDNGAQEHPRLALNEVSVMSEMERKRRELGS
jgi:hypothetical protein